MLLLQILGAFKRICSMTVTSSMQNLCLDVKQRLLTGSDRLERTISRVCVGLVGRMPIRNELSAPSVDLKGRLWCLAVFQDMRVVLSKSLFTKRKL